MVVPHLFRTQFHLLRTQRKQRNFLFSSRHGRKNFHMSGQPGFQAWDESCWSSQVGVPWTLASPLALKEFPESGALVFLQQQQQLMTGRPVMG